MNAITGGSGLVSFIDSVFDGNSICAGQGITTAQRYSNLLWDDNTLSPLWLSVKSNIAVGAQTTANMISRQSSFLYPNFETRCKRNLVIAMEIRNDLFLGASDITAYNNMVTYCQNAKNNGFDVILVMQSPSTGGANPTGGSPVNRTQAQLETSRQAVRAMFLADFPNATNQSLIYTSNTVTYADILCDLGGDLVMGDVANCSDTTLYQDGTHWAVQGNINGAAIIKRGIQYYLTLPR